jgi:hypothetical protein
LLWEEEEWEDKEAEKFKGCWTENTEVSSLARTMADLYGEIWHEEMHGGMEKWQVLQKWMKMLLSNAFASEEIDEKSRLAIGLGLLGIPCMYQTNTIDNWCCEP